MNQTMQELFNRKSVRAYIEKEIEPEKKAQIMDAAIQAPSAGNMALYSIIDITDQKLKDRLSETCDHQPFIGKASLVLVFCADYRRWYDLFCHYEDKVRKPGMGDFMLACEDTLIAAQNAVVAAESLGIGSCYIGDILENYEIHRELLNLPDYVLPVSMLVFGYPTVQQQEREKPVRFLKETLVFENQYRITPPETFAQMLGERQLKQGEVLDQWIHAFCKRKWNCEFSQEMSRSVELMLETWKKAGSVNESIL